MTNSLHRLYRARFNEREVSANDAVWREICRYLSRFIDPESPILDIGCGNGHFIRWVEPAERWATDLRDMRDVLPSEIRFVQASGLDLADVLPTGHFGTIFMSNYLEHLEGSSAVIDQLRIAAELLRPGGRVIVLQPNIRLVGARYWDFIDHRMALTERSLLEAAELAGLATHTLITRFLPYSTKGRLPTAPVLVRAYLRFRPAWSLMGKQTLYVGERRG